MQRDGGPGGAGGAGNPTGGSFTGPAEALEIIQDHAYAYSGTFESKTTNQTALSFRTGNYMFFGTIFGSGTVAFSSGNLGDGKISAWRISLNDNVVGFLKTDAAQEDMPNEALMTIIIPPYTQVKVEVLSNGASATELVTTSITGRIYRG